MKKKLIGILLAVFMIAALMPVMAMAETFEVSTWADLKSKVSSAAAGDMITLDADIIATETLSIDKVLILDLNGHTLKGNGSGSVITVRTNGDLKLIDDIGSGVITGGKAEKGGGVNVDGGNFTMEGGTITGNTATTKGGGVYVNGTVTLGGMAQIIDNYKGTGEDAVEQNLYLPNDKTISVEGDEAELPIKAMNVGVTTATSPAKGSPVSLTDDCTAADAQYFFSDNDQYDVLYAVNESIQESCLKLATIHFDIPKEVEFPHGYSIKAYDGDSDDPVEAAKVTWVIFGKEGPVLEKSGNPLEIPYSTPYEGGWYCHIDGYEDLFEVGDMRKCQKSFPDGMVVIFNNKVISLGEIYPIPEESGSGSVSLSKDGHTLTLDHVNLKPEAFTPDWLLNYVLYAETDRENGVFNIEVIGDCNIACQEAPVEDKGSLLFAFEQNNIVNINGKTEDAALRSNNILFVQYDPKGDDKTNTFNFKNIDIYGRSNELFAFLVIGDYINFTNSTIDCCAKHCPSVVSLNDINYYFREGPSAVEFNNCKLNLENASTGLEISGEVGSVYTDAFLSSHDRVSLNNCDANIVVDHMEQDETRAMRLFEAELTVSGGKLSAAVKDPTDADAGVLGAAIQVPTFKALNGADVDLISETQEDGGLSTGIIYAQKVLIQDSDLYIKATGNRAHGLYYFYQEDGNEMSNGVNALQWPHKDSDKDFMDADELQNEERGVDIINSTAEILTEGASTEDYLVNAISGQRINFEKSLIKLQSISTDEGLAVPVLAYDQNPNCGIFMSQEVPITPEKMKIAKKRFDEVKMDSYYLTDGDGNLVTEVVLKPEGDPKKDDPKPAPATGIDNGSGLWLPMLMMIGAVIVGAVIVRRREQ